MKPLIEREVYHPPVPKTGDWENLFGSIALENRFRQKIPLVVFRLSPRLMETVNIRRGMFGNLFSTHTLGKGGITYLSFTLMFSEVRLDNMVIIRTNKKIDGDDGKGVLKFPWCNTMPYPLLKDVLVFGDTFITEKSNHKITINATPMPFGIGGSPPKFDKRDMAKIYKEEMKSK
jgi:hypothetical protein